MTLTIACGAAAAITVSFSPVDQVQDEDRGYWIPCESGWADASTRPRLADFGISA